MSKMSWTAGAFFVWGATWPRIYPQAGTPFGHNLHIHARLDGGYPYV